MGVRPIRQSFVSVVGIAALVLSGTAGSVVPTEAEWQVWPEYCQVRFSIAGDGQGTQFADRIDPAKLRQWESQLGKAWPPMHHYCYGLVFLTRAKAELNEQMRLHTYEQAVSEFDYAYDRVPESHPFFPEIAVRLALAYEGTGDRNAAQTYLDNAIKAWPDFAGAYTAWSLIHRADGDTAAAIEVLQRGDKATGGRSAEIKYFLAVNYFNLGQYERARAYAEESARLGYPLRGIQNKLSQLGH